jgi:hypothetical protein
VRLPSEARDGLSRVWLEILKEKHPGVSWVLVSGQKQDPEQDMPLENEQQLATAA